MSVTLAKKLNLPAKKYLPNRLPADIADKVIYGLSLAFAAVFSGPLIITGPAYRVTVPAVLQIAYLRKSLYSGQAGKFIPKHWHRFKNMISVPPYRGKIALPK